MSAWQIVVVFVVLGAVLYIGPLYMQFVQARRECDARGHDLMEMLDHEVCMRCGKQFPVGL